MKITADQLDRATGCGAATASTWVEHINGAMARSRSTRLSGWRCSWLRSGTKAKASSEWPENLNYSGRGAAQDLADAVHASRGEAVRPPAERIANRVYANRMGNGSPDTGDGYRYRDVARS